MATVLIVSGSYYPYATANAVCAKKFEDRLKAEGHTVIYCNHKHDLYEPDYHVHNGTELYTVGKNSDLFFQTMACLQKLDMPNGMGRCLKWAYCFFRFLMRMVNVGSNSIALRNNASKHYVSAYAERISSIISERKVDMVMSVSMPFDSHRAVLEAKKLVEKRNVGKFPFWVTYCIDAYWSKAGINPKNIPEMKSEEEQIFEACDKILFLETVEQDYTGKEFDAYREKMTSLPLPLFDLEDVPEYADGIGINEGVQNWLFTGTIYDDFRNIENLASILRKCKGMSLAAHFMGKIYPKSLSILKNLQAEMPEQIVIHGRQSYEFAKGSMQRADILVNLANDDTNQIPSKIFEYMSCLKPILNVYKLTDDVGTEYLRKYPLAYNFHTEDFNSQFDGLMKWVETVKEKKVSLDELKCIYRDVLSEKVTADFYKLIEKHIG